ncbi:MFS transporter [Rubrobacter tropicus]|uniref:Putative proline/betaine transporter n=1 Tax=Rubrobacter tropicus TaxID=2653851 RepID=A0A6G8Q520_9ACTN|nr:MFS transporter [Rubrobacter tropicus]QIN81572.1 MFS transporter [Rubrobacter tropicus]
MSTSYDPATASSGTGQETGSRRRVVISTYIGTVIEWYDFYLYGAAAALVFNVLFFPEFSPLAGTLASFATLGAGFLARPIGGIVWGHFGDRFGRKRMLVASIVIMGVATTLVGLLPTYAQIGVWAPVLLVSIRIVQGISAGGEWGGAALMALEHAPTRRRGLWSSVAQVGVGSGIVLSTLVFSLFTRMPEGAFMSWGWRVPFLLAFPLVALGLYIRLKVEESPIFQEAQRRGEDRADEAGVPIVELLRHQWRSVLIAIMLVIGPFAASAVFITFGLSYAAQVGFDSTTATGALVVAATVSVIGGILSAAASDYLGRRPVFMTGAALLAVMSFVVFSAYNTGSTVLLFLGLSITYGTHSVMYGPLAAFLSELFATTTRYTGASVGYQVAGALGGGFAPAIAVILLGAAGGPPNTLYVSLFMAACCAASFVAAYLSRETYRLDLTKVSKS